MNMSEIVENSPEIVDDVFDLIFSFVESFLQIGSCAEMSFYTASEDASSECGLLVDLLDGGIELHGGRGTCCRRSTESAFLNLGLSSSSLATCWWGAV